MTFKIKNYFLILQALCLCIKGGAGAEDRTEPKTDRGAASLADLEARQNSRLKDAVLRGKLRAAASIKQCNQSGSTITNYDKSAEVDTSSPVSLNTPCEDRCDADAAAAQMMRPSPYRHNHQLAHILFGFGASGTAAADSARVRLDIPVFPPSSLDNSGCRCCSTPELEARVARLKSGAAHVPLTALDVNWDEDETAVAPGEDAGQSDLQADEDSGQSGSRELSLPKLEVPPLEDLESIGAASYHLRANWKASPYSN